MLWGCYDSSSLEELAEAGIFPEPRLRRPGERKLPSIRYDTRVRLNTEGVYDWIDGEIQDVDEALVLEEGEDYILNEEGLAKQPAREDSPSVNIIWFGRDFREGRLDAVRGAFVAYKRGVLCGLSLSDKELLFAEGQEHLGIERLVVFRVPEVEDDLDRAVDEWYWED